MADFKLIATASGIDLDWAEGGDAVDDGLGTAVIVSLFTDRKAEADDVLPDDSGDRRGWWGDIYPRVEDDRIGSRLWLLSREKQLRDVVMRAEHYAQESLQWLIEDGIAEQVTVTGSVPKNGVLGLEIAVYRPAGEITTYRFENIWEAMRAV
jgi:phage gp46-like protein